MSENHNNYEEIERKQQDTVKEGFERWNKKLRMSTGLGIKDEKEKEEWLQSRCYSWRNDLLETSPIVRYLLQHLSVLPIPKPENPSTISIEENPIKEDMKKIMSGTLELLPIPINCGICSPIKSAGLFSDQPWETGGQIKLCSDGLMNKKQMEDVLSHELIHAWDNRRFKIDWKNLKHIACTEIRANALSGDCRWLRELDRHNFTFLKQRQTCARRRAILSVSEHIKHSSDNNQDFNASNNNQNNDNSNPSLKDNKLNNKPDSYELAEKVVDQVWNSCWNDTRPFDEIY